MRKAFVPFVAVAFVLAMAWSAYAIQTQRTLTINAAVTAQAALYIGTAAINFPAANPDVVGSIPATENPVSVSARAQTGVLETVTLTCKADGANLFDSADGDVIAITNVTWTVASGPEFSAGTMTDAAEVAVASWTGPARKDGSLNFFLANSWDYATGSYTQTVVYTLTAP